MYKYKKSTVPSIADTRLAMVESFPAKPTVNGKPAIISGYANKFATVTEHKTGYSAEYSWQAVRYVMQDGGKFQF